VIKNLSGRRFDKFLLSHGVADQWKPSNHLEEIVSTRKDDVKFLISLEPKQTLEFVVEETRESSVSLPREIISVRWIEKYSKDNALLNEIQRTKLLEISHRNSKISFLKNSIFSCNMIELKEKLEKDYITNEHFEILSEIQSLKETKEKSENEIKRNEKEIEDIFSDQQRIRENLKALGGTSEGELRSRYLNELSKGEDKLCLLRDSIRELKNLISNSNEKKLSLENLISKQINPILKSLQLQNQNELESEAHSN